MQRDRYIQQIRAARDASDKPEVRRRHSELLYVLDIVSDEEWQGPVATRAYEQSVERIPPIQAGQASSEMQLLTIEHRDGAWHLGSEDGMRAIHQGDAPVAGFNPGWRPDFAVMVAYNIVLLALRHEDGRLALWFLDERLRLFSNDVSQLPEDTRTLLEAKAQYLLTAIASCNILGGPLRGAVSAAEGAFAAALASDRMLLERALDVACPPSESIVLEEANDRQRPEALQALSDLCGPVDPEALRTFFRQNLCDIQIAAAETGRMEMRSPLNGAIATCDGAWCLELASLAFRFATPDPKDSFIAIFAGFQLTLFGVYMPHRNVFLHVNARHKSETERVLLAPPERGLWRHVMRFADCLFDRPQHKLTPVLLCSFDHIGHHLWNELVGIDETLHRVGAEAMPSVIVANPDATEIYGRIDEIFPELEGKVARLPDGIALVRKIYNERLPPLHPTGILVRRRLADRISGMATRNYMRGLPDAMLDDLRRRGFHFVVLGLRVENRTVVDFPSFCEDLVEFLRRTLGRVAIVVDGQNCSESGFRYRITFQGNEHASVLQVESDIVERLKAKFADNLDVAILSTIGLPVGASIALCDRADFFITPWGAGLAKYRWISNRPGLALAGPSCMRYQPVHLYDDPVFTEANAPMYFMNATDIEDAPDDTQLIASSAPDRVNIRVGIDAMHACIREMIAAVAAAKAQ
jgi:hypothetical protein